MAGNKPIRHSVLVVDDESAMRLLLVSILEGEGYAVTPAQNGREALQLIQKRKFDLILTDVRMPEMDGIRLLSAIREQSPETPTVILTAFGSVEDAVQAMKLGAADYLTKPLGNPDELRLLVSRLLGQRLLCNQNAVLNEDAQHEFPCRSMVTRNTAMQRAIDMAIQVAGADTTVLVLGESGTGKELLARCIHAHSTRADKAFVPVNCAALAPSLLESELFGHEKGAFTGAIAQHIGRFERAHGGTLFLDEIGELDPGLQSKLLRVLQEREFERVGGSRIISVDVRIVAASNRDLKKAVQEGGYREDFYYRVSVFPIQLPPLKERREDVEPLTESFLNRISRRLGKPSKRLAPSAQKMLRDYDWPGNVRELENVLERALIIARGHSIQPEDLPLEEALQVSPRTLAEIEKDAILRALGENDGHHRKTAEQLGISLRTLQYRLKDYAR
ncbi:MAG: sigma-54 dependent transcriptional regulator [Acidobacteriota bacterium]